MRRTWICALLLLALLTAGCAPAAESTYQDDTTTSQDTGSQYVISVTGSAGVSYTGNYMVVANGASTSQSVDGTVPATYDVTGDLVSAEFQNKGQDGWLQVDLTKDGTAAGTSKTSTAYGVVTVSK